MNRGLKRWAALSWWGHSFECNVIEVKAYGLSGSLTHETFTKEVYKIMKLKCLVTQWGVFLVINTIKSYCCLSGFLEIYTLYIYIYIYIYIYLHMKTDEILTYMEIDLVSCSMVCWMYTHTPKQRERERSQTDTDILSTTCLFSWRLTH